MRTKSGRRPAAGTLRIVVLQTNHFGVRGRVQFTYAATSRGTTILRLLARSDPYGTLAPTPSRTLRLTVI